MTNTTQLNSVDAPVVFETIKTINGAQIGVATLNAPKSLNALNFAMITLLKPQLLAWAEDTNIAMVLIKSASEKAFCAGGDVVSLYKAMQAGQSFELIEDFFSHEYALDYLIHSYEKPILVWGSGIVMGGGLGLMAGASHRVVTQTSRIAMPEMTIGLYPDVGASYFLHKMPTYIGAFLGLTAASINCEDALFVSLADYFIHADKYDTVKAQLLSHEWDTSAQINHRALSELLNKLMYESGELPKGNIKAHLETIQRLGKYPNLKDKVAYILNIDTDDKWLLRAKQSLKHGCPLSCALVERQLKYSKQMSLAQCLQMELGISLRCAEVGEFQEGVRALLIEKDGTPNWQFKSIEQIPEEFIESFFTARWTPDTHPLKQLTQG